MKNSNKKKFVDLVFENMNIIYKICAIYSYRDDKDLQQDIIYQLWKSFPTFSGKAKFQTWMYRVSLNTALMNIRKKRVQFTPLEENSPNILKKEENPLSEQIEALYRNISRLGPVDKAITFLYLEKCSYEEIAKITGLSTGNVSVRLVRIKKKLRSMFNVKTNGYG